MLLAWYFQASVMQELDHLLRVTNQKCEVVMPDADMVLRDRPPLHMAGGTETDGGGGGAAGGREGAHPGGVQGSGAAAD